MKKILGIVIPCAIGAGFGVFIAASCCALSWQICALIGALVGYVIYDLNSVKRAIVAIWQRSEEEWIWFDSKEFLVGIRNILICLFAFAFYPLMLSWMFHFQNSTKIADYTISYNTALLIWTIPLLFVNTFALLNYFMGNKENGKNRKMEPVDRFFKSMGLLPFIRFSEKNIGRLMILFLISPLVVFWLIVRAVVMLTPIVFIFLWRVFRIINTDIRLMVGVCSFTGTAFGYYFGKNILLGCIIGAVGGFVSHYLELQSKKNLRTDSPIIEN